MAFPPAIDDFPQLNWRALIANRMALRDREVAMNDMQMVGSEQPATTEWLRLIKAEYLEIPGLCLTKPQVDLEHRPGDGGIGYGCTGRRAIPAAHAARRVRARRPRVMA
jgi:hypothetical protein